MKTYIVFDIETNGIGSFRPPTQTITQLAFIKFNSSGTIIKEYNSILKGATEIKNHPSVKITLNEINEKGIEPKIAIKEFIDSIDDPNIILCSHNYDFDSGLIKNVLKSMNIEFPTNEHICTMKSSTNYCKLPKKGIASQYPGYKYPSLFELASKLDIPLDETKFHDALYDCIITKNCILKAVQIELFINWKLKIITTNGNELNTDIFDYNFKPTITEINQKTSTLFHKYSNITHQSWDIYKE